MATPAATKLRSRQTTPLSEPGPTNVTLFGAVAAALADAGAYNRNDQEAPAAVLWTDRDRLWEPLLPRLRRILPILTLGPFDEATRSGPAFWIRCALVGSLPESPSSAADAVTPIVYLPGVARVDLRAVESCPVPLQPLAFLQYRGVFWSQRNGRDWTVAAYLQNADGGLGVDVAGDESTREALARALTLLADLPIERLRREAPLRAGFFYGLLNPDEAKSLLEWLDDPAGFQGRSTPEGWDAFRSSVRQRFAVDPATDGPVSAAQKLGERGDERWETVWRRFREAPGSYPNMPDLLRRATPQQILPLFGGGDAWPQQNEAAEERLRSALAGLRERIAAEARTAIGALEEEHAPRRSWVWADLGRSPLALALEHLAKLAKLTTRAPGGGTLDDIAEAYADWGWTVDAVALAALAAVERAADVAAVSAALWSVYRPWLEAAATAFQAAVRAAPAPPETGRDGSTSKPGTCVLFADGLRLDVAHGLETLLRTRKLETNLAWRYVALPGVTPTAKPARSPAALLLGPGAEFDTVVRATKTKVTAEVLRALLGQEGWQVLRGEETGDPSGRAWTELGAIDAYGHEHGWKVAHHLAAELRGLDRRIASLLDAGWSRVVVVTDHGWLMLPSGLPKAELPLHLTHARKGRCARLKADASTDLRRCPGSGTPPCGSPFRRASPASRWARTRSTSTAGSAPRSAWCRCCPYPEGLSKQRRRW